MEHSRPQLLPSTRLRCQPRCWMVATSVHGHHVLDFRSGARIGHGLYHEEVSRIWVCDVDVAGELLQLFGLDVETGLTVLQMPIVAIQRLPFVRSHALLMNVMFWTCMITGLALVSLKIPTWT